MKKTAPQLKPYHFKPGQSGNPSGKAKGLLTQDKIKAVAGKYYGLSVTELLELKKDTSISALDMTVINNILMAMEKGTMPDLLMAYTVGKPAEVHQIETKAWADDLKTIPIETLKQISKGTDE